MPSSNITTNNMKTTTTTTVMAASPTTTSSCPSNLHLLPAELLHQIMKNVDLKGLIALRRSSSRLRAVVDGTATSYKAVLPPLRRHYLRMWVQLMNGLGSRPQAAVSMKHLQREWGRQRLIISIETSGISKLSPRIPDDDKQTNDGKAHHADTGKGKGKDKKRDDDIQPLEPLYQYDLDKVPIPQDIAFWLEEWPISAASGISLGVPVSFSIVPRASNCVNLFRHPTITPEESGLEPNSTAIVADEGVGCVYRTGAHVGRPVLLQPPFEWMEGEPKLTSINWLTFLEGEVKGALEEAEARRKKERQEQEQQEKERQAQEHVVRSWQECEREADGVEIYESPQRRVYTTHATASQQEPHSNKNSPAKSKNTPAGPSVAMRNSASAHLSSKRRRGAGTDDENSSGKPKKPRMLLEAVEIPILRCRTRKS